MDTSTPGRTGLVLVLFTFCLGLAGCTESAPSQPPVPRVPELAVQPLLGATCLILADNAQQSAGAGVLVDARHGIVLTAGSVIHDHTHVRIIVGEKEADAKTRAVPAEVAFRDPVRELAWLRLEQIPAGVQGVAVAIEHSFHPGEALYSVSGGADTWTCQAGQLRQILQPPHYCAECKPLTPWTVGVTSTQPFFSLVGTPTVDASGALLGLAISGGQVGPQSVVSILDAGAIRKSFADWLRTSKAPTGVHLAEPQASQVQS